MGIRRAPRPNVSYYVLDKSISEDLRLSWGARGILIYLLGKPDNWEVSVSSLIKQTDKSAKPSRRDAVRVLLKELSNTGYLKAETKHGISGKFDGMSYVISELCDFEPQTKNPFTAKKPPQTDFPATGEPAPANPLLISNDLKQVIKPEQEKISMSENSGEFTDDKLKRFLAKYPEAVIYTPSGQKWGNQQDLDCAKWILEKIRIVNPAQREPNFKDWANDVRVMRQIDNRTHREICMLLKLVAEDSFWCQNILSPRKLRKHWDELTIKLTGKQANDNNIDHAERDKAYLRFLGRSLPIKNPSDLEKLAGSEASTAGVRSMRNLEYSKQTWDRIWKGCAKRFKKTDST